MTKQELIIKLVVSNAKVTNLLNTITIAKQLQEDTEYLLLQEIKECDKVASDLKLELLYEEACKIVTKVN